MRVNVPWWVPGLITAAVVTAAWAGGIGDHARAGEESARRYELAVEGMT